MPNTSIMKLSHTKGTSSLDIVQDKERFLVRKLGGSTLVLDSDLPPQSDAFGEPEGINKSKAGAVGKAGPG